MAIELLTRAKQDRLMIYRYNDVLAVSSPQKGWLDVYWTRGLWVVLHRFDLSLWKLEEIASKIEAWDQFPRWMVR